MQANKGKIRLLFTRHGQTQENVKGIICGQQPGTLTKSGKQQAKKIGIYLRKQQIKFDHIYVSDLGRTIATFENIKSQAKYIQKIPIIYTKLIRQKDGGILQGRPLNAWKLEADKQNKTIREYKCEKGQSWIDVNNRCKQFVKFIVENHIINKKNEEKNKQIHIFAVAHGGVLMQFHNMVKTLMFKQQATFTNSAKNCSFHQFLIEYPLNLKEFNINQVSIKCIGENIVDHLK